MDQFPGLEGDADLDRLLIGAVTDYAIYMLDRNGIVSSWNPGARRFKGYERSEIIGQHFSRFYTEEDRATGLPQRALDTAEREGKFEGEGWRVRKDGTTFFAHVVIDPIRNADGTILGFAKVTRDITERKKAQRDLETAREELFQSQKMNAVGQLTGGVAHDFNNLLMAILGSLELAKKRLPDDRQLQRLIDNAIQGAQRGTALIQRMLAFARRQTLDPKPIDLPMLVRNMVELLQRSIGPLVHIETHFPLKLNLAQADENQLELALLNLAVNARDAIGESGKIIISAREEHIGAGHSTGLPEGQYVCLAVTDNGEGMDAETLTHAVEPFFTTKGVGKGTGLGLPMVHGMTEQMGGRLVLKSSKGEGTTAEIWLPIAELPVHAHVINAKPNVSGKTTRAITALAVDDDALVLFNTVAMLEDLGHTAFEAYSGQDALEILRTKNIDLVITDQAMPRMSGVQLIEAIKREWPDMPVILATGYAELPAHTGKNLQKLSKPFLENDLAAAIAKAINGTCVA
ncbi:MAG TPA: PAS domain S-box protein [Rhizomicrobium sp.]|jgi:PAS domain S-box-containing protein|nr:PAS domain S-box protein [Rhizomicrobium sp.]